MQEVVLIANMAAPGRYHDTKLRGSRRGANIGRTREIWPCKNGWVSFGLRGGKARVPSLTTLTRLVAEEDGIDAGALTERDWTEFSQNTAPDDELKAIEQAVAAYFIRHTMQELYEIACETNLMLAPCNSPREIYASAQLAAREFFGPVGEVARFPRSFVIVSSRDGHAAPARPTGPAPAVGSADVAALGRKPASCARFPAQRVSRFAPAFDRLIVAEAGTPAKRWAAGVEHGPRDQPHQLDPSQVRALGAGQHRHFGAGVLEPGGLEIGEVQRHLRPAS